MQVKVNRLIDIINKEVTCLESFMALLTEEQKFLVENDVDSLRKSVGQQERTILQAENLEKERIKLTDGIAKSLNLKKDEASISKLVQLLEESYSVQLKELQKTLFSLYQKVERQRRKNEFLIKQSMGIIDRGIKLFLGAESSSPTYAKPSNKPNDKKALGYGRKMINRKVF